MCNGYGTDEAIVLLDSPDANPAALKWLTQIPGSQQQFSCRRMIRSTNTSVKSMQQSTYECLDRVFAITCWEFAF